MRQGNHLLSALVERVAEQDRDALRSLYAYLAVNVWRDAFKTLRRPSEARAITCCTMLEVWRMARFHTGEEARNWVCGIAARRVVDRNGLPVTDALRIHDDLVRRELDYLIGRRPTTMRLGPRTYARVDVSRVLISMPSDHGWRAASEPLSVRRLDGF